MFSVSQKLGLGETEISEKEELKAELGSSNKDIRKKKNKLLKRIPTKQNNFYKFNKELINV